MTDKDTAELRRRAQHMLDHCELTNIRIIQFGAERFGPADAASATVSSETRYVVDDGLLANRFEWTAEFFDHDEAKVALLTATLLVEYETREGFVADSEAADAIAGSTGYFAAYPYVREVFQSNCARLQLDPLVLGLLMKDRTGPRGISRPK